MSATAGVCASGLSAVARSNDAIASCGPAQREEHAPLDQRAPVVDVLVGWRGRFEQRQRLLVGAQTIKDEGSAHGRFGAGVIVCCRELEQLADLFELPARPVVVLRHNPRARVVASRSHRQQEHQRLNFTCHGVRHHESGVLQHWALRRCAAQDDAMLNGRQVGVHAVRALRGSEYRHRSPVETHLEPVVVGPRARRVRPSRDEVSRGGHEGLGVRPATRERGEGDFQGERRAPRRPRFSSPAGKRAHEVRTDTFEVGLQAQFAQEHAGYRPMRTLRTGRRRPCVSRAERQVPRWKRPCCPA